MSIIRIKKRENPYVMIDKFPIDEDSRLSWKAKGLLTYLIGKPHDWTIRVSDLINRAKDGKDSVYGGLKELEENGYLSRKKVRGKNGSFISTDYIVRDTPEHLPLPDFPDADNTDPENPPLSNKDLSNNDLSKDDDESAHARSNLTSKNKIKKEFETHKNYSDGLFDKCVAKTQALAKTDHDAYLRKCLTNALDNINYKTQENKMVDAAKVKTDILPPWIEEQEAPEQQVKGNLTDEQKKERSKILLKALAELDDHTT